jgi:phage-related protein
VTFDWIRRPDGTSPFEDAYLITHGFTKKSEKTPPSEIERAKRIRAAYKRGDLR